MTTKEKIAFLDNTITLINSVFPKLFIDNLKEFEGISFLDNGNNFNFGLNEYSDLQINTIEERIINRRGILDILFLQKVVLESGGAGYSTMNLFNS